MEPGLAVASATAVLVGLVASLVLLGGGAALILAFVGGVGLAVYAYKHS